MLKVSVLDQNGKEVRKADFDESVLGDKVLTRTLRNVVISYGRNKRQGTHAAKDRGDVAGSNRKLWKQKGTGRARCGDRRPPHWRGGGLAMGPHPIDYNFRIPARLRHVALRSALLSKFKDGEVCVVEGMSFKDGPKTKRVAGFLSGAKVKGSALFAIAGRDESFHKSVRNIQRVKLRELRELNAYDVMRHAQLVISSEAFEAIKKGLSADRRTGEKAAS